MKENLRLFIICFVACMIAVALAGLYVRQQLQQQVNTAQSTPVGSFLTALIGKS